MKINNGKATDCFLEFLDVWGSRDSQTMNKLEAYIDDEFMGFGTTKFEVIQKPTELFEQIKKEILQIPGGATFQIYWIKELTLSSKISIVVGELKAIFHMEGEFF